MTLAGSEEVPAEVISPNTVGAARLRLPDTGLFHWTLLNALKASARNWILWPSFGRLKYLATEMSVLKKPGPVTIPRLPTVPGYPPINEFTALVLAKMLGAPF